MVFKALKSFRLKYSFLFEADGILDNLLEGQEFREIFLRKIGKLKCG
jgi:hypothetical protein